MKVQFTDDVKRTIGRMVSGAQDNKEQQAKRADLLERYFSEPYGDEEEKRSQFVSSDVSDAIESTLPDLMDVFTSSEHVVKFLPVSAEDEEAAKQETDVVNHVFWKMNAGFLILLTLLRESLIQQNSYTKQGWVEKERVSVDRYEDLTPDEVYGIFEEIGDADYEVLERDGFEIVDTPQGKVLQPQALGVDPETGETQFAPITLKVRCVKTEKKYEICNIPQEQFFVTPDWHSVSLDGAPVCGHRCEMEIGELRAMGFSEESLKHADEEGESEAKTRRHNTKDNPAPVDTDTDDGATRKVTVYEAYVRADINDDGKAELCKVWAYGDGSKILKWEDGSDAIEEVSDHPFACVTPIIVPHRHVGRSLAELVQDVARVNSVLMRHTLDSVTATLYQRPMFNGSAPGAQALMDSYLKPDHGSPIDTNGIVVEWVSPPPVIDTTLPVMAKMDDLAERRTGSVRYAQGTATEALNNAAASTVAQVRDWVTMKKMLIARTMAETGLADIFRRIHRDLRSGPHRKMTMRLRNQWVDVNPRQWKHRSDLTVAVGMGSGDRDTIREGMMLMGQVQREAIGAGLPGIGPVEVRNTAEKVMETYGVEDISAFWADPAQIPAEEPQPDLAQEYAQMQIDVARRQMEMKEAADRDESQRKWAELQQRAALEKYKVDAATDREMAKLGYQQDTAGQNYALEMEKIFLKRQEAVMKDDFDRDKLEVDAATGYLREGAKVVNSAPPMGYGQVLNGGPHGRQT